MKQDSGTFQGCSRNFPTSTPSLLPPREVSLWILRQRSWYRDRLLELTELIFPRDYFSFYKVSGEILRRFQEKIPSYSLSAKSKSSTCNRSWETQAFDNLSPNLLVDNLKLRRTTMAFKMTSKLSTVKWAGWRRLSYKDYIRTNNLLQQVLLFQQPV